MDINENFTLSLDNMTIQTANRPIVRLYPPRLRQMFRDAIISCREKFRNTPLIKTGKHILLIKPFTTKHACSKAFVTLYVWFVGLRPSQHINMSSAVVILSTLFLGMLPKRLSRTKWPYFPQLLTSALVESSAVGREWPWKLFHDQISTKDMWGYTTIEPAAYWIYNTQSDSTSHWPCTSSMFR